MKFMAGLMTRRHEGPSPAQNALIPPFAYIALTVAVSPVFALTFDACLGETLIPLLDVIWLLVATTSSGIVHALFIIPATAPVTRPSVTVR